MSNVISIITECLDLYSLALCDNKIRLINLITLDNTSDFNLKNLELEITSNPGFFSDYNDRIGELSSGRYIKLSDVELSIDKTALLYLSSPATSNVQIRIKSQGEILAEKIEQVQLLPYDYLPSLISYPELCAAFVTPMQPEVRAIGDSVPSYIDSPIVPANIDMWKKASRDTAYEIIKGVYETLRDLRITYNISPILIDTKHCKIKLPETLVSSKNANSLEIAILFSSICEYLGYNSFIAFQNGKAYAGAFFTDKTFSCPTPDDGRSLAQLTDGFSHDFCIIDPTSLVNGTNVSFEDSAKMAAKSIEDGDFPIIIDIRECRNAGIYPIQNRIKKDGNLIFEEVALPRSRKEFRLPSNAGSLSSKIKESVCALDINNPLISIPLKRSVLLIGSGKHLIGKCMFNRNLTFKSFTLPNVSTSNFSEILETTLKLNSGLDTADISETVSTLYDKKELEKRLIKLVDTENSKNNLFLSLGLVHATAREKVFCAPIVLIPATLNYDTPSATFYLTVSRNSAGFNKAISEYLNNTFNISFSIDTSTLNVIDNFDEVLKKLSEDTEKFNDICVSDVCALVKAPFEDYLASLYSSASRLETSAVINTLMQKELFDSTPFVKVTPDNLKPNFFELPLILDASQTDAHNAALVNPTTIISGPSGSGKTKVAASIAFSSLKKGDKVLYVSSADSNINQFRKYAKEANFSDFTTLVSKNNLQKNSFDKTALSSSPVSDEEAIELKSKIEETHARLSNYYKALHKVREIGFSLYEAVSQYERYKTFPYAVNFTNSEVSHLSREDVVHWFDVVSNLSKAGSDCHEPFNNPLMYVKETDFSYDLKSRAIVMLSRYQETVHSFIAKQNQLSEFLGIEVPIIRENQTQTLEKLVCVLIENSKYIFPSVFLQKGSETDFITIESFLETGKDFFETKLFLDNHFTSDVLNLDIDALYAEWRNAGLKFAIAKASAQNAIKNKLKIYALNPKIITNDNISDLFVKISNYKNVSAKMVEISSLTRRFFSIDLENEIKKDNREIFDEIKKCIDCSKNYNQLIHEIYASEKKPENIYRYNDSLLANRETFSDNLSELFSEFNSLLQNVKEGERSLVSTLSLDIEKAKKDNIKIWYYFVEKFLDRMIDNIDTLKHWCAWNREKNTACDIGLEGVVSLYETEQMTYNDIKNAFLKGFFKTVSEYILSCEPDINNFSKEGFESSQNELLKESEKWRKHLTAKFHGEMWEKTSKTLETDFSIDVEKAQTLLKRDFAYNDKYYNVPEHSKRVLSAFKPCVISKSTSILSQLGDFQKFDVLLIDTAEEIKWEEIVLLLPLAAKVVLFCEDPEKDILVSSLIEHKAPCYSLSWIYSYNFCSRLINKLFYPDSTSFIFPDGDRRGIRVIHQKGTYDRKHTRTNLIEASAVVDELMKKVESSFTSSFSVIALTDEQASLIELLFTKRLQSLPESLRKSFFDRTEPFYISSLEKSTFTPCDTVIFSTTLSVEERPKYKDTFSRTIPELSRRKSRHNLISALSSARREFVLVTSLSEEMLTKFKTVIPTYAMFKELVFNISETNALLGAEMNKNPRVENSIIRQTINHIESLGYKADIDVGTNSCRVDIAVKRKNENGYIFGIIFDESAYICGGDLISRALISTNLEKNLGWKIMRIYTVEWFENSPKQLDAISQILKDEPKSDSFISLDRFYE